MPAAGIDTDPFAPDLAFNGGAVIEDRFAATSTSTSMRAAKMVRLGNGDVVVAGLVHEAYSSAASLPKNVGLVRYGPGGARVAWSNPTAAYSHFFNMYVEYPNSATAKFRKVHDVEAIAGYIFVLADYEYNLGPDVDDLDVQVLVFGEDGSFVGNYAAFTTPLYEEGAGLVPYLIPNCHGVISCPMLVAVANYRDAADVLANYKITAKRFAMGNSGSPSFIPNGTLIVDTTFGPYGNGANDYVPTVCSHLDGCSLRATSIAAVRMNSVSPTLYVGGQVDGTGLDDTAVVGIDGGTGAMLSDFGTGGFEDLDLVTDAAFENQRFRDGGVAILATTFVGRSSDEVYVVSSVSMGCTSGVGVAKLRGVAGVLDGAFGSAGVAYYGGIDDYACSPGDLPSTTPAAAAIEGDRLAIAGLRQSPFEFEVAIVRASDGTVTDDRTQHPASGGTQWQAYDGGWSDIVGNGSGAFVLTGTLRDPNTNAGLFGTTQIASDRCFAADFE
jgi:hypothetical protein